MFSSMLARSWRHNNATVMRCRVLLGITAGLWVYVLLGGLIFHLLEGNHENENETINKTLNVYFYLLRGYIFMSWW